MEERDYGKRDYFCVLIHLIVNFNSETMKLFYIVELDMPIASSEFSGSVEQCLKWLFSGDFKR